MDNVISRNRTIIPWFMVFVFIISLALNQRASADGGLTKIADGIYSYVDAKNSSPAKSFGANAGIIIGRDGIVVIDTLISAKEAKRFIKDIRAVSGNPIKYVVNTHVHLDHVFGNAEFEKLGAVIISHTNTKKLMKDYTEFVFKNLMRYGLTEKNMEGTKVAYPSLTFSDRLTIDLGDQIVELVYPGHSHTDGSIMAYLPGKKMLFTGDILFTNYHPNLLDGDIEGWIKALDYIMTLDATTIIPGHGPISSKKDVQEMKDYLIVFDGKAKELCAKSTDVEFIAAEMKKALPPRPELDAMIKANIQMKYLKK